MPPRVLQVDMLLTESESHKSWSAWFSVLYDDATIRSWDMRIPAEATWVAPGIPDHVWVATLLKTITQREPDSADIIVTASGPNHLRVQLADTVVYTDTGEEYRTTRELQLESEIPGQLPLFGDVSRETNA